MAFYSECKAGVRLTQLRLSWSFPSLCPPILVLRLFPISIAIFHRAPHFVCPSFFLDLVSLSIFHPSYFTYSASCFFLVRTVRVAESGTKSHVTVLVLFHVGFAQHWVSISVGFSQSHFSASWFHSDFVYSWLWLYVQCHLRVHMPLNLVYYLHEWNLGYTPWFINYPKDMPWSPSVRRAIHCPPIMNFAFSIFIFSLLS